MSIHLRTLCLKKISARYARQKIPKKILVAMGAKITDLD